MEPLELYQVEYHWDSTYTWLTKSQANWLASEHGCWCEKIEIDGELPKSLQEALKA